MRLLQSIVRNFSVVAVAQVITWTATFLFTLAQARYLAPAHFGELSLALSYAGLLAVVVDFGLTTTLSRDVAQQPAAAGRSLVASLVLRAGLWCLVMPFMWLATVVLDYDAELQRSILILGISLFVGGFASSLGAYFQGREEFFFPSLGSVAQRGTAAALGIAALALGQGVIVVAGVYVISSIVQVVVMIPGMRKYPVGSTALDRSTLVDMCRATATLGLFWIFGAIYYNVDMLILQRLVPLENVAWYAAAYRLFQAALMLLGLLGGTVLYPVVSRLSVGSREELRQAMARAVVFLFATGVFVALVLLMMAEHIVALLYPPRDYAEAATALRLLAPGLASMYANGVFFLALLGLRFERGLLLMAAVLAVLNPLSNLVVIPLFAQNGSALMTTATELAVLVWVMVLTPADLRGAARPAVGVRVIFEALIYAPCLVLICSCWIVVSIPVAAVFYATAVVAVGTVPPDDLRAVRDLLGLLRPRAAHRLEAGPVSARTVET